MAVVVVEEEDVGLVVLVVLVGLTAEVVLADNLFLAVVGWGGGGWRWSCRYDFFPPETRKAVGALILCLAFLSRYVKVCRLG